MRLWLRFYPQDSAFGTFPPFFKRKLLGTSLAVQWLRLCLPRQGVWVQSLGLEDPLEKEMTIQSVFLPGKSHGQRSLVGNSSWGRKSQTQLSD